RLLAAGIAGHLDGLHRQHVADGRGLTEGIEQSGEHCPAVLLCSAQVGPLLVPEPVGAGDSRLPAAVVGHTVVGWSVIGTSPRSASAASSSSARSATPSSWQEPR